MVNAYFPTRLINCVFVNSYITKNNLLNLKNWKICTPFYIIIHYDMCLTEIVNLSRGSIGRLLTNGCHPSRLHAIRSNDT